MRSVLTYCGLYTLANKPRQAVRGVAEELVAKLRKLGAVTPALRHRDVFVVFDPEAVKLLCAEAGVDVLLHGFVSDASRDGDRIRSLTFRDNGGAQALKPLLSSMRQAIVIWFFSRAPRHVMAITGWSISARLAYGSAA
jgi:FAD dependent oxidoreductase